MKTFLLPVLICVYIFFNAALNAATLTLSLPHFFIYPDSEQTPALSFIKQEYFVIDNSKWKVAQCSVWLNNASSHDETAYVGTMAERKAYWARLRLNENSLIAEAVKISTGVSDFIKNNTVDNASFTVWEVQLQPGVNHITIDFGLNNFLNAGHGTDTINWKLFRPVTSSVPFNSEIKATFQIQQKDFRFLSLQPKTGWQQADSLLRFTPKENFDSAEVSYSFLNATPSLNANEISWEAAYQPLDAFSQKKLDDIFWKPVQAEAIAPSQSSKAWLPTVLLLFLMILIIVVLRKRKII